MARSSQDSSSKRHFHWTIKVGAEDDDHEVAIPIPTLKSSSSTKEDQDRVKESINTTTKSHVPAPMQTPRRKLPAVAVARLRSVLNKLGRSRSNPQMGLGPHVVGTLFGSRRGHVHFALQRDPGSPPAFLVELATPISSLVKEMASGLVRIALECDKDKENINGHHQVQDKRPNNSRRLVEEPKWRTYCNGKKCGFATRRECGDRDWKVLKPLEAISMGAGVLPDDDEAGEEIMYMRAKFERIVGSRDSEAFYMMNPDSNGAPELSFYLLRV